MADEELVPEGDEALDIAPDDVADDTPEPIAKLASEMGWTPKEQWSGDPEKWKPADQFIKDGRDIQQSTARELKAMREQVERFGSVTEMIVGDRVAAKEAEWQRRFDEAFEAGDKEATNALLEQRPDIKAGTGNAPVPGVQEWVAKNAWFNTDPLAQALAKQVSTLNAHLPVPDQLAAAEKAVRQRFPEHFPQVKQPAAVQTGGARNANPSNREKGFADLPAESQRIALDFEKRLGVPKEKTAQSYWANEGVKR